MSFDLTINKTGTSNCKPTAGVDAKKAAMAAAKTAAQQASGKASAQLVKYIPASECKDRIRVVFDDSGSMNSEIENAKQGVVEFLRNCIPNQTSVAVHWMNTTPTIALQSDLVKLGNDVLEHILSSGGTPFFKTLKQALEATPTLTRLVAFTDGSPTDYLRPSKDYELVDYYHTSQENSWIASADVIITISKAIGTGIPIDTVFFGNASWAEREMKLLKYLSDQTGGFFLHFDPAKPNIWKQLKYLAPVNRLMLTSPAFRTKVEDGRA